MSILTRRSSSRYGTTSPRATASIENVMAKRITLIMPNVAAQARRGKCAQHEIERKSRRCLKQHGSALDSFLFRALNTRALKHHVIIIRGDLREWVRLRTVKGSEPQLSCHLHLLVHEPFPRGRVSIAAAGWHVGDDVEHDVRWRRAPETWPLLAQF